MDIGLSHLIKKSETEVTLKTRVAGTSCLRRLLYLLTSCSPTDRVTLQHSGSVTAAAPTSAASCYAFHILLLSF